MTLRSPGQGFCTCVTCQRSSRQRYSVRFARTCMSCMSCMRSPVFVLTGHPNLHRCALCIEERVFLFPDEGSEVYWKAFVEPFLVGWTVRGALPAPLLTFACPHCLLLISPQEDHRAPCCSPRRRRGGGVRAHRPWPFLSCGFLQVSLALPCVSLVQMCLHGVVQALALAVQAPRPGVV